MHSVPPSRRVPITIIVKGEFYVRKVGVDVGIVGVGVDVVVSLDGNDFGGDSSCSGVGVCLCIRVYVCVCVWVRVRAYDNIMEK